MKNKCKQKFYVKSNCHSIHTNNINNLINFENIVNDAIFPNGKKDNHQSRIPIDKLQSYGDEILLWEKSIINCENFDDILEIVSNIKIKGIGILTKYDVAYRIGEKLKIFPDKVYLHAGTKQGALQLGLIKKYSRKRYLTCNELPEWLLVLKPYQIEDFLCIYKNEPTKKNLNEYKNHILENC